MAIEVKASSDKPEKAKKTSENKPLKKTPKLSESFFNALIKEGFNILLKAYDLGGVFQFMASKDQNIVFIIAENNLFDTNESEAQNIDAHKVFDNISNQGDFNPLEYVRGLYNFSKEEIHYQLLVFTFNKITKEYCFKSNGLCMAIYRAGETEWYETEKLESKSPQFTATESKTGTLQANDLVFLCNLNFINLLGKNTVNDIFKRLKDSNTDLIRDAIFKALNGALTNQKSKADLSATLIKL